MKRPNIHKFIFIATLIFFLLTFVSGLIAQNGFEISWWTVGAGGGIGAGPGYTLADTIGQPISGSMAGGNYMVSSGFWAVAEPRSMANPLVYLPLVRR